MAFSKAYLSPTTKQTFVNTSATSHNNNNNDTSKNINKNQNNNNGTSNNNNTTPNKKFNPKYFNPLSCLQCSPGGGGGGDRATICSLLLSHVSFQKGSDLPFLDASSHLYKRVRLSVGPSVHQ